MNSLIDILPGLRMSVEEVTQTLSTMWDSRNETSGHAPSDFRASQMNLILHFGLQTTENEALERFEQAIHFAQRYPCRILVLCPAKPGEREALLEGKLFSQCYLGSHLRDLCCCEALILGYSIEESDFLENQVSLWLEPDLPIYHWFNRVPPDRIQQCYLPFLKRCRRVLYDSAVEGHDNMNIEWPVPEKVNDLAKARTLPLRQHIGNFLSVFEPDTLVQGLESVQFQSTLDCRAETLYLKAWHEQALNKCLKTLEDNPRSTFTLEYLELDTEDPHIKIEWKFKQDKRISWNYDYKSKSGQATARLDGPEHDHHFHIEPLNEASALAEALFF